MRTISDLGFAVPDILIPQKGTDLKKWAVIACDQYTSEPEYWKNVEDEAGDAPSTLNLVLPEVYLNTDKETEKLGSIAKTARAYLDEGILQGLGTGFILTGEGQFGEKARCIGCIVCAHLVERHNVGLGLPIK